MIEWESGRKKQTFIFRGPLAQVIEVLPTPIVALRQRDGSRHAVLMAATAVSCPLAAADMREAPIQLPRSVSRLHSCTGPSRTIISLEQEAVVGDGQARKVRGKRTAVLSLGPERLAGCARAHSKLAAMSCDCLTNGHELV